MCEEESCSERELQGMKWSKEVSLTAKVLCKYNRTSVQYLNHFSLCQANSLCAHKGTHTPTFFFHQTMQRLRNAVINFPIITTATLQIILLSFYTVSKYFCFLQ